MSSLRYVILRHEIPPESHFDVMIETVPGGPLMTWRSPDWPIIRDTNLTRLEEHRNSYLDYEGPVSNNRGQVKRIAAGACEIEWITRHDLVIKLADSKLQLQCLDDNHWVATAV